MRETTLLISLGDIAGANLRCPVISAIGATALLLRAEPGMALLRAAVSGTRWLLGVLVRIAAERSL